jgi:hypothetical protein
MIAEIAVIMASWHPQSDGMNSFNPGAVAAIAAPTIRGCEVYAFGGVYRDSYKEMANLYGAGLRRSWGYVGADIAVAHVHGSHLDRYPVAPIPSVFVGIDPVWVHVSLVGKAVSLSARIRAWEF